MSYRIQLSSVNIFVITLLTDWSEKYCDTNLDNDASSEKLNSYKGPISGVHEKTRSFLLTMFISSVYRELSDAQKS